MFEHEENAMSKGVCNCTYRLWNSREREEKWVQCKKPANHLGDHVHPVTETRWRNAQ